MQRKIGINVQRLFITTILLKIGLSFLGWRFQDPWVLGTAGPLAVMSAYIVIGIHRQDSDLSDEKFADTCYYLGFIFTITSIIFSLFDLPNIGTRIQDISVRFGAAMVSTVFGLTVRVILVSFKKDYADAVVEVEDAVIAAAQRFHEQLDIAAERFFAFQTKVDNAAAESVEKAEMRMERLSQNHSERLAAFFADLTERHQAAGSRTFDEIDAASRRLSETVDGYTQGIQKHLTNVEAGVTAFTDAIAERLKTTTFPDDYFVRHLEAPLIRLKQSTGIVSENIETAAATVGESTAVFSDALTTLRKKADVAECALDSVIHLTTRQHAVLDAAQGQLTVLEKLTGTLSEFGTAMTHTHAGIAAGNIAAADLSKRMEALISEFAVSHQRLGNTLQDLVARLTANAAAVEAVADKLDEAAFARKTAVHGLSDQSAEMRRLTRTLVAAGTMLSELLSRMNTGHAANAGTTEQEIGESRPFRSTEHLVRKSIGSMTAPDPSETQI